MAVVKCPSCGKYVDSHFGSCLSCGVDILPSGNVRSSPSTRSVVGIIQNVVSGFLLVSIGVVIWVVIRFFWSDPSPEEIEREAVAAAEKERKGFHCLSGWDGSHRSVVEMVKRNLRDPSSFEHIETRITPVDEAGKHVLFMEYRAANGFGGLSVGTAVATVRNTDCDASITVFE